MSPLTIKPTLLALGAALLASSSGFVGWKLRDSDYQAHLKRDAKQEAQWQKALRLVEGEADRIVTETRAKLDEKEVQRETVYRTITKEIPHYVTRTEFAERVVASGGLPAGLVWLHNQAASGSPVPLPSGLDPNAPTGVDVPELATVLTGNYSVCASYRNEAEAWREWYTLQLKLSQKEIK